MLELMVCSFFTILPDYLIRRYLQGKRIGHEITLFSVWYELRWGLTGCLMLALTLFTLIFYFHPATSNVTSFFRTVTILPESGGRVSEVMVQNGERVEAGDVIFRLDATLQQAAVDTAEGRIGEIDAAMVLAQAELEVARGQVNQAQGALDEAEREFNRKNELNERNPNIVSQAELDLLLAGVETNRGAVEAAKANAELVTSKITTLLPAQKESAAAELERAEAELAKTVVYAGITGQVVQFALKPGDYVSPVLRPAGILIPENPGGGVFEAGFPQVTAQVLHKGMIAEITCASMPFVIVPMVITEVQSVIAAGQFRPTDSLVQARPSGPGNVTVYMRPLYEEQELNIPAGSACMANAYTSNHARLQEEDLGFFHGLFLHAIDTVGVIHAAGLRIRALLLPMQTLVLTGH